MLTLLTIPLIAAVLLFRTFCLEPFNVPAGSMVPTLLVGDYFFAAKGAYGYSRFSLPFAPPVFAGRVFGHAPQRGDVVVFRLPRDPDTSYVKRIVGLPGDRIQLRHGVLYLNDAAVPRRPAGDYTYQRDEVSLQLHEFVESLPRGDGAPPAEYTILKDGDDEPLDNTQVFTVPPHHYFALGDNRDNSLDSRVLSAVGYIPDENLIGRAVLIFFSAEGGDIRSDRALTVIR